MRYTVVLAFLLVVVGPTTAVDVLCFHCFGNSSAQGQLCSIDKLCSGASCYFQYTSEGQWEASCSSDAVTSSVLQCSSSQPTRCSCSSDFCNGFDAAYKIAAGGSVDNLAFRLTNQDSQAKPASKEPEVVFALPIAPLIYCQECGNVTLAGETREIPCDLLHLCQGNFCVHKRGEKPISYCGADWEGDVEEACVKSPTEPEQCICKTQMCNKPLPPQTRDEIGQLWALNVTTEGPQVDPNPQANGGLSPVPQSKKPCRGKFSANDQANYMGSKLKDVLVNGFGDADGAIDNFQSDVNNHLCDDPDDDKTSSQ